MDSYRLNSIAILLEQNKFPNEAVAITRKAVVYNPGDFDAWRILSGLSASSLEEKSKALAKMRELDPLNKDFK